MFAPFGEKFVSGTRWRSVEKPQSNTKIPPLATQTIDEISKADLCSTLSIKCDRRDDKESERENVFLFIENKLLQGTPRTASLKAEEEGPWLGANSSRHFVD